MSFLPRRFRGEQPVAQTHQPSWMGKRITPLLKRLSRLASTHPIHTVVIVALLASTSYIGLLQESLFEYGRPVGRADWPTLVEGSRALHAGPETQWNWQPVDSVSANAPSHLALVTLVFPDASSSPASAGSDDPTFLQTPLPHHVPIPENVTIHRMPSTLSSLSSYSQDSSLVFALPFDQTRDFLAAAQEIPTEQESLHPETHQGEKRADEPSDGPVPLSESERKMWIMKAARAYNPRTTVRQWLHNAVTEFIDLLKNAETLDIVIMALGYISMHLTFVSLFVSMRHMGSNFWLAASVLLSSVFAFLFGLLVTTKLGVPVTMVLLSEGLPFLVVTIGFEKAIVLTRAVLSHAVEHRSKQDSEEEEEEGDGKKSRSGKTNGDASSKKKSRTTSSSLQYAVQAAIKERGYEVVQDYALEIGILVVGAASGVQGGLQQFCFLGAWILFFDCLLLFTFYTAILSIKLEINRIKRHVNMRKALEEDGVSSRVAEKVAKSNDDWPVMEGKHARETTLFGRKIKSSSIPKFKVLMVSGFLVVNILNLVTIPFRNSSTLANISSWAGGLGGIINSPSVDPFKVASSALNALLAEEAKRAEGELYVTVLAPIKYELEFPSIHYALPSSAAAASDPSPNFLVSHPLSSYGGRMVGSLLTSLEDPVLSKWIIVALAMSVALNGYLFNAARWGIKDPNFADVPIDRKELARAENFNGTLSSVNLTPGAAAGPGTPFTPFASTPTSSFSSRPSPLSDTDYEDDDSLLSMSVDKKGGDGQRPMRSVSELEAMIAGQRIQDMTDEEVVLMSLRGKIPGYSLEKKLKDFTRAVKVRRMIISRTKVTNTNTQNLEHSLLPYRHYNWERVFGQCCENVIGFMPLPLGVAGPLVMDGQSFFLPMATTEGVLVASTSRGCKAINAGGGAVTVLTGDGMTRGPCITFGSLERAGAAKVWLDSDEGQSTMKKAFDSTSNYARLRSLKTAMAGTNLYIRFKATTGDAMGMNMISKGVEHALAVMKNEAGFDDMDIVSVSGNYCTDKKAAAINWIDGRGKSVVAEAMIPAEVVRSVLKCDVDSLVELNVNKNLIGSAMAGALGGFNAHAANIVAAIFLATGQDPAQVVESANCMTIMKNVGGSLQISVSMPSIEVGTLGGGTILEPQAAVLDMLGVRGPHRTSPGENARRLARIIAAAVMAGELSLCSALAAGHLVQAHMQHNRSVPPTRSATPAVPSGLSMTKA